MKEGPNITTIAALIGDPARANMLTALMSGKALTASELANEAGVTPQTTSAHLAKLLHGGMVSARKQGRHKYFTLANNHVADLLEQMMGLAAHSGHMRLQTGPKDPAMRFARACYNHLAGERGVHMYDYLMQNACLEISNGDLSLTMQGRTLMQSIGIDLRQLETARRPLCKPCLDWSARRNHLGGALGVALLTQFEALSWVKRTESSRIVSFTARGKAEFARLFPL
ncbi:MAG: helix-turn-helix domain-containing protein [Paracoccaceae bacterium]